MLLRSIGRSQALADAIVRIVGSEELDKTRFRGALLKQELGGLRYIEQIRLGESFTNPCIPTDCLVDRLPLRGRWRGFSLSSSVSSLITHRCVILCLHSSSLLFYIPFCYCVIMIMDQSSLFVYPLTFTLFHTQY